MTARQSSPSESHSDVNVRKRVCKACDRCRLKKSKCDGSNPCGRCRADNAICVFGERKKAHDKVYPKGYVEMLEQQQVWLVNGLQELYRRSCDGLGWPGDPLKCEPNGHPLTHDLLAGLGALDSARDRFEESPDTMQQRLWSQKPDASHMHRQDSSDGSSDGARSPSGSFARHQAPPTPPSSFSPSSVSRSQSLSLPHSQQPSSQPAKPDSHLNHYAATMPMQGVVNPIALQGPQWPNSFGSPFDDVDFGEYPTLSFEEQYRAIPLNCITSASLMDTKSDYEDLNQFLSNSNEIPSI